MVHDFGHTVDIHPFLLYCCLSTADSIRQSWNFALLPGSSIYDNFSISSLQAAVQFLRPYGSRTIYLEQNFTSDDMLVELSHLTVYFS